MIVSNALVTAEDGFAGRPGPAVPNVRGLCVAGDWVGPDGMLADGAREREASRRDPDRRRRPRTGRLSCAGPWEARARS